MRAKEESKLSPPFTMMPFWFFHEIQMRNGDIEAERATAV
jgi:hypothetical protein